MPCYHPIEAFRLSSGQVTFVDRGDILGSFHIKCGQCVGCRLERSRQWAVRCVHEAKLYDRNCFISLTYDPEHVPPFSTLRYPDFQKFMKRLRRWSDRHTAGFRVRPVIHFYMAGEYGDKFGRPHYHACLFNFDFPDRVFFCHSPSGHKLYRSKLLEKLWPFGFSSIGELNFETAAYTARYIMKKINGDLAEAHYSFIDMDTGEIIMRTPEFNHMSLHGGGIGGGAFDRWHSDWYPKGEVLSRGKPALTPRYYDKRLKRIDPEAYADLQSDREERSFKWVGEQTVDRLRVREVVAKARLSQFKRSIK